MEAAHLTQAYDHARNAQHELAAGEFANAAKDTGDAEALRILNLLEHHHHRLASIIKSPSARTAVVSNKEPEPASNPSGSPAALVPSTSASVIRSASPTPSVSSPPKPTSRRRPSRDPSSSIATNLATARGIPGAQPRRGAPASAALSITNAVPNTPPRGERQSRAENQDSPYSARDAIQRQARRADESIRNSNESLRPSAKPDKVQQASSRQSDTKGTPAHTPQQEEGFQRFYSTFENIFSAISAPLAFASLPLSPSSTPSAPAPPTKSTRPTTTTETDLTSLISRPALRALKEDQGPSGPFANAAESFYVVPTSGGTVSYAGILSHQHPHQHPHPHAHQHAVGQGSHLPDLIEEDASEHGSNADEFVDAVETHYPPSPTSPRHMRRHAKPPPAPSTRAIPAGRGTSRKTMEELELENTTLRALLDKQSRRLQMWEATSQSQSLALAQSFRARAPPGLAAAVSDPSALAQAVAMGMGIAPPLPSPSRASSTGTRTPTGATTRASPPSATAAAKAVEDAEARIQELAAQVEALSREKERGAREIEKLTAVLARYREQWEKLKAGARGRRERERAKEAGREKEGENGTAEGDGGEEEGEEGSGEGEGPGKG